MKGSAPDLSWLESEAIRKVRLCTIGWPVTGAIETGAADLRASADETLRVLSSSEWQGRIGDAVDGGSIEQKKREGYP
jgi:hypothetical protein